MYQISYPKKILAGFDALQSIEAIIDEVGAAKVLIFTDGAIKKIGLLDQFVGYIPDSIEVRIVDGLVPEPSYHDVRDVVDSVGDFLPDLIVGLGGGSVMDATKLFSVLKDAPYSIEDLLESPLLGKKLIKTVMIPTTSGTGAEVTYNAIVSIPEKEVKQGIVNPAMTPDYVIVDPVTVAKLPKAILAATAMDALCHGIECFTSNKANAMSDLYALACTKGIFGSIRKAFADADDLQARLNLQMAALYGGLAISSSGTHGVHALSYPLGGKYHIAHGVSNAVLLHPVMKFCADACEEQLAVIADEIEPTMAGKSNAEKIAFVLHEIDDVLRSVELPMTLDAFGIAEDDLDFLVDAAFEQKRLLNQSLKAYSKDDIRGIYVSILK